MSVTTSKGNTRTDSRNRADTRASCNTCGNFGKSYDDRSGKTRAFKLFKLDLSQLKDPIY